MFFINWIGLSSGLACALLIYLWVADEMSVDKFHPNDDRLFQVMVNETSDRGIITSGNTQAAMAEALAREMPEIEFATVATPPAFFPTFTIVTDRHRVKGIGKFAGRDFFSVFPFPIVEGSNKQLLSDHGAIVISERLAKNLFNTTHDLLGKVIEWQLLNLKRSVVVTGVFKDVPYNASENFDLVLSFDSFEEIMGVTKGKTDWNNPAPFRTYLSIHQGTDINHFKSKIEGFLHKKNVINRNLFIQRYSENYLHGKYENGKGSGGRIVSVRLFSIIAFFVLIIACINFMNLSTAKASRRVKEVGIKKAIGAPRGLLIYQYLGESMSLSFLSLLWAIVLVQLALPQFNEITQKRLFLGFDTNLVLSLLSITLITGLIAGSYPALYLSGFDPAAVMRGATPNSWRELWTRKGLVVFQFSLSLIFIVAVLVVHMQLQFIQTLNPGYHKDNVLFFETDSELSQNADAFLQEIKSIPSVVNASSMLGNFLSGVESAGMPGSIVRNGKTIIINSSSVNYDMLETLGIQIKEGRSFSRDADRDTMKVIYNEAAIEALDLKDPIGKTMDVLQIIGVAKNFHYQSLHEEVKPYSFRLEPHYATTIMVRIKAETEAETISKLKQIGSKFSPGYSMDFKFLDQEYEAQYTSESIIGMLSRYFAGIAIIISCLGLFGLASFTAERRLKEISIRKILGSSEWGIVYLLSSEFAVIIFVSILVGLPVSYVITKYWLDTFAFKVHIEWWYFAASGLCAVMIALLTIALQTMKAARVKPTECLMEQ